MTEITRRSFIHLGAGATAGLMFLRYGPWTAVAQVPDGAG